MNPQYEITPTRTGSIAILSICPKVEDHRSLDAIIRHSNWTLFKVDSIKLATAVLEQQDISVILCERDLAPGNWTDVLECIQSLPHPPALIVVSRLADEHLWAEALNLGAYDVLAKPFNPIEVIRCVKLAWDRRHSLKETAGLRHMTVAI
jgi:DNA-binding response OmpR family regulator